MDLKPTLYGWDLEEAEKVIGRYGEEPYRARQLLEWLYRRHVTRWEEFRNLPKSFLENLEQEFSLKGLGEKEAVRVQDGHKPQLVV